MLRSPNLNSDGQAALTVHSELKKAVYVYLFKHCGNISLGKVGMPDEIAKAVVFLTSHDSSFVNGIKLFVEGGIAQFRAPQKAIRVAFVSSLFL